MSLLRQIQEEQIDWQHKNFPGRPAHQPLLGIIEEFGELSEVQEGDVNEGAKIDDAIGDVLIFMCDYCTAMGLNIEEIEIVADELVEDYPGNGADFTALIWLGKLCHSHLKFEQRIRGPQKQHMLDIRWALAHLMAALQIDLNDTVSTPSEEIDQVAWMIWQDVKKRDWAKHRAEAEQVTS